MTRWSKSKEAGFALAALLADDRTLSRVEGAIPAELAGPMRAQLAARQAGSASDKALLIGELLAAVRPPLTGSPRTSPARLGALLAPKLPRALARELVAAAPPSRPDFAPPPELLPRLLRLARKLLEQEGVSP